jgi:murein L,D-transpeptidase YafK
MAITAIANASDRLPTALISIPESVDTVFVAETSTAQFHRFDRTDNKLVHSGSFYMSIGQEGPGKQSSGDKRTPLGVYFVTEQLDTSKLHEKYGVTAFVLDYPNVWDLRSRRSGDGIWVHGVHPEGGRRPERDTDGCIALSNKDLAVLAPEFSNNVTPVVVVREVAWAEGTPDPALQKELESQVADWARSKANGDLFTYLSMYDDDFERWGMNKSEWSSLSVQTGSLSAIHSVVVSDLLLVEYPEEEGMYLSRFRQAVAGDKGEALTTTRLYWRRQPGGTLKIIAEDDS